MASRSSSGSPKSSPCATSIPADERGPIDMRAEDIGLYKPGLLCPVHLGDLFKDARYRVIRKLGYGVYSTVWLAVDQELKRYVAIKIATAKTESVWHELELLRHMSTELRHHPGRSHVMALIDSFEHHGPNGVHECFVFEVMGSSIEATIMKTRLKTTNPSQPSVGQHPSFKYSLREIKSILRQILSGIDFLHKCGIVHSDIQPGNVLVSVEDLSSTEESRLAQYDDDGDHFVLVPDLEGLETYVRTYKGQYRSTIAAKESESPRIKRRKTSHESEENGEHAPDLWPQDKHKPRYLTLTRPLDDIVEDACPVQVKVSDMGGAFFSSSPPEKPITPLAMRSPELILGHSIGPSQDIWSFGCLVFELLISRPLFEAFPPGFYDMIKEDMKDWSEHESEAEDASLENGDKVQIDTGEGEREAGEQHQQEGNTVKEEKSSKKRKADALDDDDEPHNEDKPHNQEHGPHEEDPHDVKDESHDEDEAHNDKDELHDDDEAHNHAEQPHHKNEPPSKEEEAETSPDDDHLWQLASILRPLPPWIMSAWPTAWKFCHANGEPKRVNSDGKTIHVEHVNGNQNAKSEEAWPSLEELFSCTKPFEIAMTPDECTAAVDLIRYILQYVPEERPSAEQLLKHPWFADEVT